MKFGKFGCRIDNVAYLNEEWDGDKDGEDKHSTQSVKVKGSTPALVHQRDGDQRHDDHDGADPDRRVLRVSLCQPRRHEQIGRVIEDLKVGEKKKNMFDLSLQERS